MNRTADYADYADNEKKSVMLNESALIICEYIKDKYATLEEITNVITNEYNINFETAQKDVINILNYFSSLDILEKS